MDSTNTNHVSKHRRYILQIVICAMMVALITICSWISIPLVVPFTLQTFAMFLALFLLGGIMGTESIAAFVLLGAIGVPVFSGFNSGISAILGPTGGFLIGFILAGILYIPLNRFIPNGKNRVLEFIRKFIIGLLCSFFMYCIGIAWFLFVFGAGKGLTMTYALSACVIPFIIPDLIKLAASIIVADRLQPVIKKVMG